MYEYHILFIHLLVDGHVGYFFYLSIMNNTALNICAYVLLWVGIISCSLGYKLREELLGHRITTHVFFWGTTKLFFKVATKFHFPISSACKYHFSTFFCLSFYYSHSRWCNQCLFSRYHLFISCNGKCSVEVETKGFPLWINLF